MNLKEAFRYQNFLAAMMNHAAYSLTKPDHCLSVTKVHLKSKANPEASDVTEEVDAGDFYPNNDVMKFMCKLVFERRLLTGAISDAKATKVDFDLDTVIEMNKSRMVVADSIKSMLSHKASTKIEKGQDYKFNVEGNQSRYFYDVEVRTTEAFDRDKAKKVMRELRTQADEASAFIDKAMINTVVDYDPPFDVNDAFDDVMEKFLKTEEEKAKAKAKAKG